MEKKADLFSLSRFWGRHSLAPLAATNSKHWLMTCFHLQCNDVEGNEKYESA